ncbi:MAG: Mur ligase family protein [Patescibacteria group bacterium]
MKSIFKFILKYYLKYLTKYVLMIHRPTIVAIAGSTNKTFVKDEINRRLREAGLTVRSNPRSFNTEIGLPLAILGLPSGFNTYRAWLPIIWQTAKTVLVVDFPRFLVLELGVSDPGDMKYLLSIIEPDITVITDITQRYLEGFADMDELIGEYQLLAASIKEPGLLVLNNDNRRVKELENLTLGRIVTFGLTEGADWRAVSVNKSIIGQSFDIVTAAGNTHESIKRYGEHHLYAALAGEIIKNYVAEETKNSAARLEPEEIRQPVIS